MHGMELVEDYRWLEVKGSRDVREWYSTQNDAALDYIESLPELPAIERRLARIFRNAPPDIRDLQYAQGVFVCKRNESLVVLESEDSPRPARVLLDVEAAPQRRRPSVDYAVLAHRGKYVAAAVSLNGTEEGTIQIFDTATGKALRERIPQAFVAVGGDMTWDFADAGLFYTRYPNAKPDAPLNPKRFARPQIYYHKLGDDLANDRLIVDEPADGEYVSYTLLPAHRQYYLTATTGWGTTDSTTRLYRPDQPAEKRWLPFAGPADKLASIQVAGAAKDRLLLLSHKDAPRGQILTMPLDQTDLTKASVLLPQSKYFLHSMLGTDSRLFVVDRLGGSQRLHEYTLDGRFVRDLQLPPFCSVEEFTPLEGDTILYKTEGYTQPPTWWYYNARLDLPPKRLGISEKWGINFDDIEVLRDQAQAPDGTRVPLTILRPKGVKLDGERPVYLEGYGGHAHVETPNFVVRRRLWFDAAASGPSPTHAATANWARSGISKPAASTKPSPPMTSSPVPNAHPARLHQPQTPGHRRRQPWRLAGGYGHHAPPRVVRCRHHRLWPDRPHRRHPNRRRAILQPRIRQRQPRARSSPKSSPTRRCTPSSRWCSTRRC
jgi:prolyl oligopeptidase